MLLAKILNKALVLKSLLISGQTGRVQLHISSLHVQVSVHQPLTHCFISRLICIAFKNLVGDVTDNDVTL